MIIGKETLTSVEADLFAKISCPEEIDTFIEHLRTNRFQGEQTPVLLFDYPMRNSFALITSKFLATPARLPSLLWRQDLNRFSGRDRYRYVQAKDQKPFDRLH